MRLRYVPPSPNPVHGWVIESSYEFFVVRWDDGAETRVHVHIADVDPCPSCQNGFPCVPPFEDWLEPVGILDAMVGA